MSLILDALRKADAERQSRERPAGIDSQPVTVEKAGTRWGWPLLAVLLVVVGLTIGWWWWPVQETVTKAPVAPESIEPQPVRELASPLDSVPAPAPQVTPEPRLQTLYDRARPSDKTQASEDVTETVEASTDQNAIANLYRQGTQPTPATRRETGGNTGADKALPDESRDESVDAIRDLPLSVQDRIPTLMYAAHDYLEGSRPSVVLNGERYHEGQRLPGGLQLERIEEDGVIIRVDDHRFKLRALSSWVNM